MTRETLIELRREMRAAQAEYVAAKERIQLLSLAAEEAADRYHSALSEFTGQIDAEAVVPMEAATA